MAARQPNPLPDPIELGFSPKFQSWYGDQLVAIDKTLLNTRRFTALAMPTGSGKSLTGIATALLHPGVRRALYLTSTKGLQDQLNRDFSDVGLFDVRGQRNYPCRAIEVGGELDSYRRRRGQYGCDEGPCHARVRCSLAPQRDGPTLTRPPCDYYGAVHDACGATLVSTNYAMYLASTAYGEGLGKFDLLICDEAHDTDKELESFLTFDIAADDVRHIGVVFPKATDVDVWRDWGIYNRGNLTATVAHLEKHPPKDAEGVRELRTLKAILGKFEKLALLDPLAWIYDGDATHAKFAPMRVNKYAEEYLFRKVPHVLLMSATMTKKTLQLLGVAPETALFWECPSRFPIERRPVICINTTPSVRVDARMTADDKFMWLRRIDRLIEPRRALGRKGIIHTVSYLRVKELLANSEHKDVMLVHDQANTREIIQQFKASTRPHILVSPSIVTGYDFPDDECRYQILGKVPIPDMRGPIMSIRKDLDPEYSGYLAMLKLVQACGRPVRNPRDWAETFICDDHFSDWFLHKYRRHAPRWFLDAIEYTDVFPEPMKDPNLCSPEKSIVLPACA